VDRIASAWLIRRFVDPEASVKLVDGHDYAPEPGSCASTCSSEFTRGRVVRSSALGRFGLRDPAPTLARSSTST
jgi:hypothetical protein